MSFSRHAEASFVPANSSGKLKTSTVSGSTVSETPGVVDDRAVGVRRTGGIELDPSAGLRIGR